MNKTISIKVAESAYNNNTGDTALLLMVVTATGCDRNIFVARKLENNRHPGWCRVAYYEDMLNLTTSSASARWRTDIALLITPLKAQDAMQEIYRDIARLLGELEKAELVDGNVYYTIDSTGLVPDDSPELSADAVEITSSGEAVTYNGTALTSRIGA